MQDRIEGHLPSRAFALPVGMPVKDPAAGWGAALLRRMAPARRWWYSGEGGSSDMAA